MRRVHILPLRILHFGGEDRIMKKNDYRLIAVIILIAALLFFIWGKEAGREAAVVEVTVNGKKSGSYRLDSRQEIDINGTNMLVIRNGMADMTEADCPDKLCVNQKAISKNGESIVCLPNKVVVTVISGDGRELDEVAH